METTHMVENRSRIASSLFLFGLLSFALIFPANVFAQSYGGGNYGANEYGGTDNISPSISLSSPSNGAEFVEGDSVTITASSSDPDGTISQVEFFVGSVSIGTTSSPYTINWTATDDSSYTINAVATDNEGAKATSTVTIVVNSSSSGGGSGGSRSTTTSTTNTLVIPTLASDATPTEIEEYRQVLISLVQKLITQIQEKLSGGSSATNQFARDLTIGSEGSDVLQLQVFLNSNGYIVSKSGAGSPGQESTHFGELTREQLARFQLANNIVPAVGFFGPVTRTLINTMLK